MSLDANVLCEALAVGISRGHRECVDWILVELLKRDDNWQDTLATSEMCIRLAVDRAVRSVRLSGLEALAAQLVSRLGHDAADPWLRRFLGSVHTDVHKNYITEDFHNLCDRFGVRY